MNTTLQNLFQFNDQTQWEDAAPGIQRQVFGYDDTLMLVKVKFEKGAVGALHQHYHSQSTYVESGVFELTIGGETKILKQGDGFFVPPHVLHGCICMEAGVLIDAFSPHREDFLKDVEK